MSCYRTLDSSGRSLAEAQLPHKVDKELALRMYRSMASVQTVDTIFYEAQRQVCCFVAGRCTLGCCLAAVQIETHSLFWR